MNRNRKLWANGCAYSKCGSIADVGRGPELLYMAKYPVVFALIELPFLKFLDLIMWAFPLEFSINNTICVAMLWRLTTRKGMPSPSHFGVALHCCLDCSPHSCFEYYFMGNYVSLSKSCASTKHEHVSVLVWCHLWNYFTCALKWSTTGGSLVSLAIDRFHRWQQDWEVVHTTDASNSCRCIVRMWLIQPSLMSTGFQRK